MVTPCPLSFSPVRISGSWNQKTDTRPKTWQHWFDLTVSGLKWDEHVTGTAYSYGCRTVTWILPGFLPLTPFSNFLKLLINVKINGNLWIIHTKAYPVTLWHRIMWYHVHCARSKGWVLSVSDLCHLHVWFTSLEELQCFICLPTLESLWRFWL